MSIVDKIKSGTTFWAGEDSVAAYRFIEHPPESGKGYITRERAYYCDVRAFYGDYIVVYYKFFGNWIDAIIKLRDLALSPEEIIARLKPVTPAPKPRQLVAMPEPSSADIRLFVKEMDALLEEIPNGLSRLKDALTFAMLDLNMFTRFGHKSSSFQKALTFARSIPPFVDVKSDECTNWMLNDEEHLKYM